MITADGGEKKQKKKEEKGRGPVYKHILSSVWPSDISLKPLTSEARAGGKRREREKRGEGRERTSREAKKALSRVIPRKNRKLKTNM